MEFKGTKGEWKVVGKFIKCGNESIASVWSLNTEDLDDRLEGESWISMRKRTELERFERVETIPLANVKLIASAPDLLEALQEVMKTFVLFRDEDLHSDALKVKIKAQKAIEKALS